MAPWLVKPQCSLQKIYLYLCAGIGILLMTSLFNHFSFMQSKDEEKKTKAGILMGGKLKDFNV